jgi:peptidoglycan hydrolase CwlO-like protein
MSSPYNDNRCSNPINCINKDCNFDHHLVYDDRKFIYNIINPSITEDNAWSNYENKYNSHSPTSSKLSYSSTLCSPIPNLFVSLCKKEDSKEDDMISIIEDMKNIRSNIDIDIKKADSIKEQINKLKEEFNNTEEKINKDKNKLKELAIKIISC